MCMKLKLTMGPFNYLKCLHQQPVIENTKKEPYLAATQFVDILVIYT